MAKGSQHQRTSDLPHVILRMTQADKDLIAQASALHEPPLSVQVYGCMHLKRVAAEDIAKAKGRRKPRKSNLPEVTGDQSSVTVSAENVA